MLAKKTTIACLLIVSLMIAGSADAIRKGRLIGKVVDPDGKPIEGVTVKATSDDVPEFNEMEITDKKGVFKLDFEEIEVVYKYVFSKAGYITLKTEQTWNKDGTDRFEFVLTPGGSTVVDADAVPITTTAEAGMAYNEAVAAFEAKDIALAEAKLEEALGHDPEFRQAWQALSVIELEQGHYQEAINAAEKAMELGSTDMTVLRSRWEAYRQLGDDVKTAEAQADIEKFGMLAEEAKRIYNEGIAKLKAGDKEGAFESFEDAVSADPNLEPALFALATTGLEIGKYAESAAAAEAILQVDSGNEDALRIRYNAALELQDDEMLIDALVGLAPVEPEAARRNLWLLAMAAYDANQMDVAKARFGKVLEVDPNNAQAHYLLGLIYLGEGEEGKELVKTHLGRFLELAPDDPDAASARDILDYVSSS